MKHLCLACAMIGVLAGCESEPEEAMSHNSPDGSEDEAATDDVDASGIDTHAQDAATDASGNSDASSPQSDAATDGDAPELDTDLLIAFLDIYSGSVSSLRLGSAEPEVLVTGLSALPDGIAIDEEHGHIYWTNMGGPTVDDGSIQRVNLDGSEVTEIVAPGGTFTPKQLQLDPAAGKLYWSDREGMRIMRANLDGSDIETLVTTGSGAEARANAANWCVGIAIDPERRHLYWTQKGPDNGGTGTIKRAGLDIPAGESSSERSDIEILFEDLPEPIDLALDLEQREIYWADRGDNTISRAPMDAPSAEDREILISGLAEAIGVALDLESGKLYFTALDGRLGEADLDGQNERTLHDSTGGLTGLALAKVPAAP